MTRADWDQKSAIQKVKEEYEKREPALQASYDRLLSAIKEKIADIQKQGPKYIPECDYTAIEENDGQVPKELLDRVKETGCLVVHNVIPSEEVLQRKKEIQEYWYGNQERTGAKARGVMNALGLFKLREHPNLFKCITAANSMWHDSKGDTEWCPTKPMLYIDGCRIREPGTEGGMFAHVDSGGIERWWHPEYKKCYQPVWDGKWEELDSYDVAYRTTSVLPTNKLFRAFQGWVAMSEAGVDKGTIRLCPMVKEGTAYYLLKQLLDKEMKAWPTVHSMSLRDELFPLINEGLVTIPDVQPGDFVLWHCDLGHSVEFTHNGNKDSSVAYIGASPMCPMNAEYLVRQKETFRQGGKGPDFVERDGDLGPEEKFTEGRPTADDLSDIGKKMMGFAPYEVSSEDDEKTRAVTEKCNKILGF
ncbi:hypothetical protein NQZ79_g2461 [Umbelopsis isabellina]|nr:hypothetical protein NQZ79_g2461 [Umbelopsis isabellina]